ncbi:MAG: AMP-binding protein [Bauldia litoralis]
MLSLGRLLQATVAAHPRRVAVIDGDRRRTWREVGERVARTAGLLHGLGLRAGDRFAILARNSPLYDELKWAGHWAGIVPVPVNWRLAPPELRHILTDAGCRLCFAEADFQGAFDAPELASLGVEVRSMGPELDAARDATEPMPAAGIDPDAEALLLYTGGTTGRAKGVRLSHANIVSNGLAFGLGAGARGDDVFLHVAPMFHSADLLATAWVLQGAAHCYLPAFSPAGFLEAVERQGVTATVTVPAMLMAAVSHPAIATADLSSLRLLVFGAAPMAVEWIERVAAAFPAGCLSNCYGLTEVAPDLTIFEAGALAEALAGGRGDGRIASVGRPNPLNELRVAGPDGAPLPPGEAGELWARGPNIMMGYHNLPEETAAAFEGGWFRTGDVARIDADGYVYLLDRLKDLVISGGENIYTAEVEAALHRHPGVLEASVIGVPDERMGEALVAVIVPRDGAGLTETVLVEHCRPLIGGYKIPRRYAFVEALPKSAMGKVLKADLRTRFGPD